MIMHVPTKKEVECDSTASVTKVHCFLSLLLQMYRIQRLKIIVDKTCTCILHGIFATEAPMVGAFRVSFLGKQLLCCQ